MIEWPNDYRRLQVTGLLHRLTNSDDPIDIWDAEFLPEGKIDSFERLGDQKVEISPFAITGGGHYWAYLADSLPESDIVLCYRDSYEAEYYSRSIQDFIFKRTVEFAGNEELGDSSGWTQDTAKEAVSLVCSGFADILSREMLVELRSIANTVSAHSINGWTTLISESKAKEIIERLAPMKREDAIFEWRG
ncbi:hypothetical protein [Gimesia fumaroli]|uniref:Uncharacterized protein n=1 Tax=Gimesia fumaroli TaxID=2527976 RepID=A0A518ID29_9PLAN|nr:hypothetical protein [Gimesia fumaroli]QDV51007.1 hypothetical protein Enr17x_30590 [Gimesia fumaroli]